MSKPRDKLPERINTEIGEATLGRVTKESAIKEFLCPLCNYTIDIGEAHIVAVPVLAEGLRRHLHESCLNEFIKQGFTIKLHPNEPNAARYYLG